MANQVRIRLHHVSAFVELVSTPNYKTKFLEKNGEEIDEPQLDRLISKVNESTTIKIVPRKDDICAVCYPSLKKKVFGCWMSDEWATPYDAEFYEPGKTYSLSELKELEKGYVNHILNTDFNKYKLANFMAYLSEFIKNRIHPTVRNCWYSAIFNPANPSEFGKFAGSSELCSDRWL